MPDGPARAHAIMQDGPSPTRKRKRKTHHAAYPLRRRSQDFRPRAAPILRPDFRYFPTGFASKTQGLAPGLQRDSECVAVGITGVGVGVAVGSGAASELTTGADVAAGAATCAAGVSSAPEQLMATAISIASNIDTTVVLANQDLCNIPCALLLSGLIRFATYRDEIRHTVITICDC